MKNLTKKIVTALIFLVALVVLVGCNTTGKTYKVEFDLNGAPGSNETVTVKENSKLTKPTDPQKNNYEFDGWFKTKEGDAESEWIFSSDVVTEDLVLYAKWDKVDSSNPTETIIPPTPTVTDPTTGETIPSVVIPSMPDLSVRHAEGDNGMVAAASGYASQVGIEILEAGGNAFDAAVAVGFALNVVEPNASGIGGGGFMVAYNSGTGKKMSFNYREFAPAASHRGLYSGAGGTLELGDGPGSFGVPMLVDGLLTVLEEQGTMSLEQVMRPAINLARYGFPITQSLAKAISDNFSKIMRPTAIDEALDIYTDGLSPLKEGDLLINQNLANVLEKIIDEGKDGFYKGAIARAIVNSVAADGSVVTLGDFESAIGRTLREHAQEPVTGTYKDEYELISMYPPSSGGTTLIEIFNMLEILDEQLKDQGGITSLGHNSAEYIHAVAAATQLAFGDRRRYVADPNFVAVPVAGMISKEFAANRWANFDPNVGKVFSGPQEYGDPWAFEPENNNLNLTAEDNEEHYSTTHFSIVDKYGNLVSATHTINYFFGNGYMPRGTGIHLNNIMSPLSINQNSVNLIMGGKVGISNMSPVILLKGGEPYMTIGSPGSMRITSAVVQTILNIIEFEMSIQDAINQPRVHSYATENMEIEGAIGEDVIAALRALGHIVTVYKNIDLYFGGVQGILYDDQTNKYYGGADPRRDGKAIGY